jgi:hypothetical protein
VAQAAATLKKSSAPNQRVKRAAKAAISRDLPGDLATRRKFIHPSLSQALWCGSRSQSEIL